MSSSTERKRQSSNRAMSCLEVAEVLGCSAQRIHMIEQEALRKLARHMRWRGITFADLLPVPDPKQKENPRGILQEL